ncbi:MAG: hypothetical protein HZB16_16015 [Armatimonadetes bacterium]|nr:hypothetical protein [Armatimonadota bacterium]
MSLALLTGLLLLAAPRPPLVGVEYFAGWWPELPNKWHGKGWTAQEPDWRTEFPGRVPLLGAYNDQATMDAEIVAAADHGVDFFSILYYHPQPGGPHEVEAQRLNRGLAAFLASPNAGRMKFMLEFCNAPGFDAATDAQWAECIKTFVAAMRSPSYLRVGGRLVLKIHGGSWFLDTYGNDAERTRRALDQLRAAVREAGLGELIIGAGIMSRTRYAAEQPLAKVFDFTATYMSIPEVEVRPAEHPYALLAAEARVSRELHAADPLPWMPYLAVGWNPRPWTHPEADPNHRRFFTFATREQWTEELRAMKADLAARPTLGLPLPDGTRQPAFTIYAWNEFGEGGILAPTQGEQNTKLEAIRDVFGTK